MPKEVKTEQVQTRLTKTNRKRLERLASKYKMTPSFYISHLIEKAK